MGTPIYLDVDDEITSAVTRIRSAGPGPVVLVVPFGSRLASSRINFRLLAREAAALERELLVVAPDPAVRALAASADLATYATMLELQGAADSHPATGRGRESIRAGGGLRRSEAEPDSTADPAVPPAGAQRVPRDIRPATDSAIAEDRRSGAFSTAPPASVGMERMEEPRSAPPAGRGRVPRRRTIVAVGLVLGTAVIALSAGFAAVTLLPTARIVITPATETLGPLEINVLADPAVTATDVVRMVIPATRIEIPVEVSGQFEATGKELIEEKAKGSVTFQNCDTGSAHSFPAGSVVATPDGVRFVTGAAVNLDRAKINPAFACTAGSTSVTAVAAGPEGNVVAGTITRLPSGYDPIVLSVVNRSATSGGTRQELTRVTRADVDAALASLKIQLNDAFSALAANPDGTPAGSEIIPGTASLGEPVATLDPDGLVGQELAAFDLGLGATGTVLAVDSAPVEAVAQARLMAAVPAGYQLVDGSARAVVSEPAVSGGTVIYAVTVRGAVSRTVDLAALRDQVLGLSIPAARTVVEPFGAVEVTVWPDWVTAIPEDPARVEVVLGEGPDDAPPASSAPTPSTTPGGNP